MFCNIFPLQVYQRDVHQAGGGAKRKASATTTRSKRVRTRDKVRFDINIVITHFTETFSLFSRGFNIIRPEPESVFARKPG